MFDSIALGIVAGVCCNSFTPIHPALCLVIGIAVFLLLLWLQRTSVGFWVIGGLLTLIYAAAAGLLACLLTEKDLVWGWVTFGIVFLVIGGLHLQDVYKRQSIACAIPKRCFMPPEKVLIL